MTYQEGGFSPPALALASWATIKALLGTLIAQGIISRAERDRILLRAAAALPDQADDAAQSVTHDARRLLLASRTET
ncbi:MAG: hypothetical protein K2X49_28025 [Acetobacteraceae bacterium]|nr:hypothetical protein [Acetobacteraceae bacterium]